jgi:hypothetical protein
MDRGMELTVDGPGYGGSRLTSRGAYYLQTEGSPAVAIHPFEYDASYGSFNPQAQTTWTPVDYFSWLNYNVHGYGIY